MHKEGQACVAEKENCWGFLKQEDFNPYDLGYSLITCAHNCPHNTFCCFLPYRIPKHTDLLLVLDKELQSYSMIPITGSGSCGNSKHRRQIEAWINYLGASALGIVIITVDAFQQGHISVLWGWHWLLLQLFQGSGFQGQSRVNEKWFPLSRNPHCTEGKVSSSLTQCGT